MTDTLSDTSRSRADRTKPEHEVIIVGAGVAGIYQIKRLVDLGVDAVVLEAGEDLGGTWFWNRYPGARFDSESYTYGYSFSKEVLDEWHWKERFSGQPENLRYLNFVADKFGLRQHMQFNARISAMRFDEEQNIWTVELLDGRKMTTRFVVTGVGLLSAPTPPKIDGMESFEGESFHTFHWPKEPVELADKKVAVIGTGATGIQCIAEIADKVGELKVFQRRPNWSAPLNNSEISEEEMADIRSRYDEIFAQIVAVSTTFRKRSGESCGTACTRNLGSVSGFATSSRSSLTKRQMPRSRSTSQSAFVVGSTILLSPRS